VNTVLRPLVLSSALLLGLASAARAQITASEINGHIRFLASDLLEGRAPGTRGGRLAEEYIASTLLGAGVKPGVDTSFFQRVPIDIIAADQKGIRVSVSGKSTLSLAQGREVVVWAGSAAETTSTKAELVFAGYGVNAPEYKWNDFRNVDVKGKILLVLVNDPPAPAAEPTLFGGKAMTWYGRWPYKFEEGERQGAAGVLVIHTTERAGYGWATVVGSGAKERRALPRDPALPPPMAVQGWIKDTVVAALLQQAGLDFAALRRQAEARDFTPVSTGITLDVSLTSTVQHLESMNVVGVVPGTVPARAKEYIAYSAHWDHLGIGPVMKGDSIYNGAEDNASGVADLLAIAAEAARHPLPRSQLFVFVTAEESGLLGSAWFAANPTVPAEQIVANLNVDGGNLLGRTADLNVLGDTKSSLGPLVATVAKPRGMVINPDEHPERGAFYRSDHFAFAKAGVPAVSIGAGTEFIGRPKGWGTAANQDYTDNRYHQPQDRYEPDWDLRGAVQLSEVVLAVGKVLGTTAAWPTWNANAEFHRKPKV
jgi:Zn-dependent M28 family amino/carboxypeptidase